MGMEMYDKICRMVEADIEELVAKGSLDPQDYPCLGAATPYQQVIPQIVVRGPGVILLMTHLIMTWTEV